MEGNRNLSGSRTAHLLSKIREVTKSLLNDVSHGRSPSIAIDTFRNYCRNPNGSCSCKADFPKGKEIVTLLRESHVHRLDVLLRVLLIVQRLLQENRHGSKRDIYYMHPSVFRDQSVVDRAINELCILLGCSRHNLNVAQPVPVRVEEVEDILSVAEYILVVEKESVFQRLANDQFCRANRCIVITGRGYPDIPTRRFLRLLIETLHLPAYCLVDCDPYGFDILSTYRFGSMQMAYDAKFMRNPEMSWLGAFPSDFEKYSLPTECLLPLTAEDKRKTEAILLRCYLQREAPDWRFELELMLHRGVKFEIEAFSVHSLSYLSREYIPSKIHGLPNR
ncbi:TP6A_N domain-containing protein, partial [Psidium guajava]